jgi:hypothetical protein
VAFATVLVLVGATLTAPASAQQAPAITPVPAYAVAVASDPAAQRVAPALQQAGFQALATTAPFVLVAAASAVPAAGPPADQALLDGSQNVNRALQTGLQAMSNLELDSAAQQFNEVVSLFEATPALVLITGTQPFATALIDLGINSFLSGDEGKTEEFFRYAVSLDPTVMPDAELFPDVITVYNRVIDDVGSRNLVRAEIETVPEGATVFVDGLDKGPAPLSEDVLPGKHVFAARADGYASGGVIVDVRGGRRPTRVTIELEQSGGASGPPQPQGVSDLAGALMEGSGREVALYRSIADQVGARILLVLWLMPGGQATSMVSIQLFDRQADRVVGNGLSGEVPLDSATIGNAAYASIQQVIGPIGQQLAGPIGPTPPPPPPPPWGEEPVVPPDGDNDGGIASQWWFWTIIGAVVAGGAATGIYFGLTASEGPSGPDAPQLIMEF